jgi:hypothetical protein
MTLVTSLKQTLRNHLKSPNPFVRHTAESIYAVRKCVRLCIDAEFRSIVLLKILNSAAVHQDTALTCMNRYPGIFSACRNYFNGREDLKILSYGCSTGEEVLTLRQYFPTAFITGAEINKRSLAMCGRRAVDERIAFVYSDFDTIRRYGPFDAIFCMAVLQRNPHAIKEEGVSSLKKIYPFEKFDRQVGELDLLLKKQGLLVVHYSQYSFGDAGVAAKYEALESGVQDDYILPRFDRNSELVENPAPGKSIYVKIRD